MRLKLLAVIAAALVLGSCGGQDAEEAGSEPQFVESLTEEPAVVWAVGDGNAGDGTAVARMIAADEPDRFLYLGDVYEEGTAREFATNYDSSYGSMAAITAPTLGDHESPNVETGYEPYWEEEKGVPTPAYYAFDAGGWEILSLNSEFEHAAGSKQLAWLEQQVAEPGTCRLAFWHRPRFSSGTVHTGDPDVNTFWRALDGRASIVVNGNEHSMQRFAPFEGIIQFIAGSGGNGLYELAGKPSPRLEFANDDTYGALRFALAPGRAEYRFIAVDGQVLDSGSVRCEGP